MNSRRQFLLKAPFGLLATVAACRGQDEKPAGPATTAPPAGAPPTFGAAPEVGPEVSASTFKEAAKLMQVQLTHSERSMAADSWRRSMAALYERRTGPRKITLEPELAPATRWIRCLPAPRTTSRSPASRSRRAG